MDLSRARLRLGRLLRPNWLPRSVQTRVVLIVGLLLATSVPASSVTYTYDALGRLVLATYDDGSRITYALDAAGNRVSVVQSLDTTAPGVPTALSATATSPTHIHLTWTACPDTSGSLIAGYEIFRAGAQIGTSTTASYDDSTVISTTTYSYTVACYDNAVPPNVSAQSSPVSVTSLDGTPPSVPTGLTGTAASSTTVNLSWTASTDNPGGTGVAGYKVYRARAQIGTSATGNYSDTTTLGTTVYSYTVAAYDNAVPPNVSAQSAAFTITTPDTIAPPVPGGLTASAPASGTVNLAWTGVTDTGGSGLAGYKIYRAGVQIGTSGTSTYSDTTTLGTTAYTYTVAAYDNAGNNSAQSGGVNVTTPDTIPPSVPTGLIATVISGNQVNLSWNPSTDTGGSGLAGYVIFRNGSGLGGSATNSYVDTAVGGGTTYIYTVLAYDNAVIANESAQSAPSSVTTPANIPGIPGTPSPTRKVTTLSWTESWGASSGPIHHYILQRTINLGTPENFTITAPTTSMAQAGGNGDSFTFQVQGCNSSNQCSAWSGQIGVTICEGGTCP
jgi:YD repeat-containing protein